MLDPIRFSVQGKRMVNTLQPLDLMKTGIHLKDFSAHLAYIEGAPIKLSIEARLMIFPPPIWTVRL